MPTAIVPSIDAVKNDNVDYFLTYQVLFADTDFSDSTTLTTQIPLADTQTDKVRAKMQADIQAAATALGITGTLVYVLPHYRPGTNQSGMLPAAGAAGQVPTKVSGADYDYAWATPAGGGGASALDTVIEGYNLVWNSANSLSVTPGHAYIPGLAAVLSFGTAITKTSLVFAASTWYHIYLYSNAGTPDIEVSTQAPADPYRGTARVKGPTGTPDNTRRYLGSVKSNALATPAMFNFRHAGDTVYYREHTNAAPFSQTINATGGTLRTWNFAAVAPMTADRGIIWLDNQGTGAAYVQHGDAANASSTNYAYWAPAGGVIHFMELGLSATQTITSTSASGGNNTSGLAGYRFRR